MVYALHHLLRDAARSHPTTEAVRCRDRSVSYAELEAASDRLAAAFVGHGVLPGDRVGIYLPKCVEVVVAVYAAMKAGAAYVPLDSKAPVPRVATVADDCAISAVVSTEAGLTSLVDAMDVGSIRVAVLLPDPTGTDRQAGTPGTPPCPTIDFSAATAAAGHIAEVRVVDMDLAYILYTSGSTGTPKGVMLTHRNALTFVEWCANAIGIGSDDRLSNHAPLHFDLSVFDLFLAVRGAATVVLVPEEQTFFGSELAAFIEREGITIWYSVPSALMLLERALDGSRELESLRTVVFAGEVYPTKRLRELRARLPNVDLWNLYGPTETNVCTYLHVGDLPPDDRAIPIGHGCGNTEVFAIKDDGSVAVEGEEGELLVRGSTVMRGYWGRPEATDAVLVPDPRGLLGDRVYRTGDLVRLRPDGDYEFLGRRDHQIKSRGFRIELAEIEIALGSHQSVGQAAAVAVPHDEWGSAIVAFVVIEEGEALTEQEAKRHVAARLPRYMVPTRVLVLEELPRTSTGKVDRRRLTANLGADPQRDTDVSFDPWQSRRYPVSTHGRRVLTPRRRGMAKKDFNLKPLEDRIVVKPGDEEETTSSGIVIPDTAKEKPQEGSVVAVGPGRFEEGQRVPLDVAVGDTVIYSKYGGTEVKVEGDEYLILSARDVLAVIGK